VGYFGGGVNLKCFYMISVHNKHETYSLRDVKLVLTDSMQEYSIADLIKPFDTATFNKPSLPCSQYFVTWTWQPPAPPKLQASTLPGSAVADLATPSWPMSQHDLRHTGMSPYVGSQTNEVKWSYVTNSHAIQAGNQSVSSPVIGSDGTVYVGSNDKNLYAFRGPTFISSCNPIEGAQGHMLTDVIITGINFTGATNISFGEGITISSFTVNSATQITASISITPEAIPGSRVVSITTPGGTGTLPDGFTVQRTDRIDPVVLYIIGALILCALAGGVIFMTTRRKQRPNI
jgi:hypothetical protein